MLTARMYLTGKTAAVGVAGARRSEDATRPGLGAGLPVQEDLHEQTRKCQVA